ncbi:MAG: peptidylprolyl isomerase [Patescibacteria group bacterium]|jgi:cyclophilin family peptidyl-prolyl cis-trans isomerase
MGKKARIRKEKKIEEIIDKKELVKKKRFLSNPWSEPWHRIDFWVYVVAVALIIVFPFVGGKINATLNPPARHEALITTSLGDIDLKLYDQDAPNTVANFEKLADQKFYDGLTFHRVIKSFMIQSGDPKGDGTGGPGYEFNDEINDHKIVAGTLAMANSGPNTNGSQFFIVSDQPQPQLDGKYTVFGEVLSGMDVVKSISEVATDSNDKPVSPVYINSIEIK